MGGLSRGISLLFNKGRNAIGNAIDNFLLDADARKAIEDEVRSKFQPRINRFSRSESKRADTIKELGDKLNQSKKDLQDARDKWQQDYDSALATAKNQRQTDINAYDTKLQGYQDALDNANRGKQDILDQLYTQEANVNLNNTIFTDVKTGKTYIFDPRSGGYKNLDSYYRRLSNKDKRAFDGRFQNPEYRLFDKDSGNVVNPFDAKDISKYGNEPVFDSYLNRVQRPHNIDLREADDQINKANSELTAWQGTARPSALDENQFKTDYKKNNSIPNEYNFNGQTYRKEADLTKAYQDAVSHLQTRKNYFNRQVSKSISERDAEIAKRIQDAKDIKKAKLALGAGVGAGALAAGAAAMYGGDDTDNTDNTNNIDAYTGEYDLKLENTPEGKTADTGKSPVDTGFDPDKAEAEARLAGAAYDKGVEDGNSIRSSDDLGNNIGATTRGHTMEDRLYELIKAMKDPYKADAIANYIYSRHGDDPEVQNLGWRGWLNKYYGDSLRSIMNIDPSGYKGMHVSGGL